MGKKEEFLNDIAKTFEKVLDDRKKTKKEPPTKGEKDEETSKDDEKESKSGDGSWADALADAWGIEDEK